MIVYILAEHVVTMYANHVNDYYIYVIIICRFVVVAIQANQEFCQVQGVRFIIQLIYNLVEFNSKPIFPVNYKNICL